MVFQQDLDEPILQESLNRFILFPIEYQDIWDSYKLQEAKLWNAGEIDYAADKQDWDNLDSDERFFIENVLAFFANADSIVMENLMKNFSSEVQIPEAKQAYAVQNMIEAVHAETYSKLISTFITDKERQKELFSAIVTLPCVAKKTAWALKWLDPKSAPFAERLIAFAVVEGVFFSGSFCSIFWLKSKGKMVKALGHSNEFIARDEAMHCNNARLIYNYLLKKVSQERVHEIFREAVEIETEFISDSLPCKLINMNSELMTTYIKYVANYWIQKFGYDELYPDIENPFPFMVMNDLDGKSNFFEIRPSAYTKSYSVNESGTRIVKTGDTDF